MPETGLRASIALPLRRGPRALALLSALEAAGRALPGLSLPPLRVELTSSRRISGGYEHGRRIVVSRYAEHTGLALLHELGHAFDHHHRRDAATWASETEAFDPWWRSVRSSRAFARLVSACRGEESAYWPTRRESFARSFAQWVAWCAGDADLRGELERRAAGAGRQWEAEDFAPIAAALDTLVPPLTRAA